MKKFNKIIKYAAVFLVGVLVCGVLINVKDSSNGFLSKERNPDNMIVFEDNDTYIKTQDTNEGVEIDVDDNGVITLKGKATSGYELTVAQVTLEPGTYTISGCDNTSSDFRMYVKYNVTDVAISGNEDNDTFTISEEQTVSVKITWKEDYNFGKLVGTKIKPVIVEGKEIGDFYK